MRLDRVAISGFMGFPDPAVLDLRDVPAGLVAITGTNGHGKTRLLDAGIGALYGAFPSRDGALADYATERDAYVEALYSIEGRGAYRSRINVDGLKRNSDAVLEQLQADGTAVALNDGKVSTHREKVSEVFPAKELLLASAFAAQNRAGSFVTLDRGKRKDLFGKLLGLEHYATMAATAKAVFDLWDSTRARLTERRDLLARDIGPAVSTALESRANQLQQDLLAAELRRGELQADTEAVDAERAEIADQAAAHGTALERQRALTETVGARRQELRQVETAYASAVEMAAYDRTSADRAFEMALASCADNETTATKGHAARVTDLDERIAGNEKLNSKAEEIRAAVTQRAAALEQLEQLRDQEQQITDALDAAKDQVRNREAALRDVDTAARDLKAAQDSARTLTVVKFGDECGGDAPCQFVARAAADQARIPTLQQKVDDGAGVQSALDVWRDTVTAKTEAQRAAKVSIAQVEARIRDLDKLAKYDAELSATQARIEGYQREKLQADEVLATRLAEIDQRRLDAERAKSDAIAQAASRLESARVTSETRRAEIATAITVAEQQLTDVTASLPETEAAARRLAAIDGTELPALRRQWTENEATLAAVTARIEELARERATFDAKRTEHAAVSASLRTAEDRLLIWQLYVKAFSRDGLPTLEIAAAGPTVSNLTNDLLNVCFGSRFTVELVTQEARADRKGLKETFDLHVFDNQHGGDARDLADLSGGERVIVDEALRAALALYVNSRNQAPIRTCWRDETTGALDPENATRYVAMLRRLQELGGFAHVIFVTHNPDAARLADTEIVVTNGQPELRRAA